MEGNASAPPSNMPPISMKFMHIKKEEEEETFVVKGKKSVPTEKKPEISAKMEEEVCGCPSFPSTAPCLPSDLASCGHFLDCFLCSSQ